MSKNIGESTYFLAWFVYWITSAVGAFIIGIITGAFVGGFLGALGVELQSIKIICGMMGFIIGITVSYVAFRFIVQWMIVAKVEKDDTKPAEL